MAWISAVFFCLGAADTLSGDRLGLGSAFRQGFAAVVDLLLLMTGFMALAPWLGTHLAPVITPVFSAVGCDPSLFASLFLSCDAGGAVLAAQIAQEPAAGLYNGLIVAAFLGSTINGTIFNGISLAVRGLTLFVFCISVLQETTGIVLLEGLTPLAEIYPVICSIGAFLAGILPFFAFVQRLLTAPLAKLAARLQLEPASITGLVVTSANCIPTLLRLDTLEERGITLNTAYAVVAAYSAGDFLAFTLQFSPAHALPMMAGRLLSGLLAVVLCLKTTPKTT